MRLGGIVRIPRDPGHRWALMADASGWSAQSRTNSIELCAGGLSTCRLQRGGWVIRSRRRLDRSSWVHFGSLFHEAVASFDRELAKGDPASLDARQATNGRYPRGLATGPALT